MTTTSSKANTVHVITSTETRRRWSPADKKAIIQESSVPGQSVSAVARKYGIAPNQLFNWRRIMESGALTAVGRNEDLVPASEAEALKAKIPQFERLLGQKTVQIEILKRLSHWLAKKTHLTGSIAGSGRFPVKTVADTLAMARANLCESQLKNKTRYTKEYDEWLLPMIRRLTDQRPDYRRITSMLNIKLEKRQKCRVNYKQIYRIMNTAGLLLQRHNGRPKRTHEGKVMTLKSNIRWCSF